MDSGFDFAIASGYSAAMVHWWVTDVLLLGSTIGAGFFSYGEGELPEGWSYAMLAIFNGEHKLLIASGLDFSRLAHHVMPPASGGKWGTEQIVLLLANGFHGEDKLPSVMPAT
ncbi:hypothetical protein ACLOJK_019278 [Asimina triloba]